MKIDILGTEYEIIKKKFEEEPAFEERSICAYCDEYLKQIVLCDMHTYKYGWDKEPEDTIAACEKLNLRHELVHAFLNESGLSGSAHRDDGAWSKNEEMLDWMSIQLPKIYKAYEDCRCL